MKFFIEKRSNDIILQHSIYLVDNKLQLIIKFLAKFLNKTSIV
jgi:hypothetical protein